MQARQSSCRGALQRDARRTETAMAGMGDERRIVGDVQPAARERAHAEVVFFAVAEPKCSASKSPMSSRRARRMKRQTPTPVGRRGYARAETRSTSAAKDSASKPVGIRFSSNGRGTEQSVALLESGVTVPMSPEERLASISFSSHRGVTIVSLLRRTTSRDDALMPRFTLSTKPRRVSLRRICVVRLPNRAHDRFDSIVLRSVEHEDETMPREIGLGGDAGQATLQVRRGAVNRHDHID